MKGVGDWLANYRHGTSSCALAAACLGGTFKGAPDYPHDSDDFSRCVMLQGCAPAAVRDGLKRLAEISGPWHRLASEWDDLIDLFAKSRRECSRRIDELCNPKKLRAYETRKGDDGRWDSFPFAESVRSR